MKLRSIFPMTVGLVLGLTLQLMISEVRLGNLKAETATIAAIILTISITCIVFLTLRFKKKGL